MPRRRRILIDYEQGRRRLDEAQEVPGRAVCDSELDLPKWLMNLVTFDLDGTLADSETFDGQLYVQSVRTVLGTEIEAD